MNLILILPIIAGLLTQTIKLLIKSNKKKFNFKNLMSYSGMPSGHTAIVSSLMTISFFEYGFKSPIFAISCILAIIIIRDALGIRKYLGQHGKILNTLIKDLSNDEVLDQNYPYLLEKIGHTPQQVLVGFIIGILVSYFGFLLF